MSSRQKAEKLIAESTIKAAVAETIERLWPLTREHREQVAVAIVRRISQPVYRDALRALSQGD